MIPLIVIALLGLFIFLIIGSASGIAANNARHRLALLIADLAGRIAVLVGRAAAPTAPETEPPELDDDTADSATEPDDTVAEPDETIAEPDTTPASGATAARRLKGPKPGATPTLRLAPSVPGVQPLPPAPAIRPFRGLFDEALTARWLVWIGAIALALAAAFLVMHSIDQGWIHPAVRCGLGALLGLALIACGDYLHRRPLARPVAGFRQNTVSLALTAAGLFSTFASVYAAHALYDLVGSAVAFGLLAAVAFGGFALAYRQGPPIAVLGLLGSLATPWIVATAEPSSWALFSYLFAIVAASLTLFRLKRWGWLAFGCLVGVVSWTFFWMYNLWFLGDLIQGELFMVSIAALYLFVRPATQAPTERPASLDGDATALSVARSGGVAAALLGFPMFWLTTDNNASLVLFAMLVVVFLIAAYRDADLDRFTVIAAALVVGLMAIWYLPRIIPDTTLVIGEGGHHGGLLAPFQAPEVLRFISVSSAFSLAFAGAGFVSLWRAPRSVIWAVVSAGVPVLLFANAYWRLTDFAVASGWSAVALGLTLAAVAAAAALRKRWQRDDGDVLVAVYTTAAVAAFSLGATMILEQAWLSVALAAQLPALAWIQSRLRIETLRPVAIFVAMGVLVRLALNPYILDYPLGTSGLFNWILYGYGLPAVMFFAAARRFRATADDGLVRLLEAGALIFSVLLVSFEIRQFASGALVTPGYGLLEQSLQSVAWLVIALILAVRHRAEGRPVALYGARLMTGIAAAQVVLLQVLADNPLWSIAVVQGGPIFNGLVLAYAAPAALFFLLARERSVLPGLSGALNGGGLVLVSLYLSLEIRLIFQGPVLSLPGVGDAEFYTYSAVWLVYALALLGLGHLTDRRPLRHASLLIALVTVGKVFLFDMAGLTGLYRVLSFLGLGLALVGIGYFYQAYVLPARPEPGADKSP